MRNIQQKSARHQFAPKNILSLLALLLVCGFVLNAVSCDDRPNSAVRLQLGSDKSYVKIRNSTVYVNASDFSRLYDTAFDPSDTGRSFDDFAKKNQNLSNLFYIHYPVVLGARDLKKALFFVVRDQDPQINLNDVILREINQCTYGNQSSESEEHTLASAKQGGLCRFLSNKDDGIFLTSFLGTVFDSHVKEQARGIMLCETFLGKEVETRQFEVINDQTTFNHPGANLCYLGMVSSLTQNEAMALRVSVPQELNDKWVTTVIGSGKDTIRLRAFSISIDDKTIPQFFGGSFEEFKKEISNEKVQEMMKKNGWGELGFQVELVTSSVFSKIKSTQ